jgi:hypothetical protein
MQDGCTRQESWLSRLSYDNVMHVMNYARQLHKARILAHLLKLDMKKVFDSVRWDYLVELLQRHGFHMRFPNWLVALLSTASSRVLVNGVLGRSSMQGDYDKEICSLGSYFFIAIDPLQSILERATANGDPSSWASNLYSDLPLC